MKTASDIIQFIGRDAIVEAFGLSVRRVNEMAHEGEIPAALYDGLERLAGRPLPRDAFSFKSVAS